MITGTLENRDGRPAVLTEGDRRCQFVIIFRSAASLHT